MDLVRIIDYSFKEQNYKITKSSLSFAGRQHEVHSITLDICAFANGLRRQPIKQPERKNTKRTVRQVTCRRERSREPAAGFIECGREGSVICSTTNVW